MSIKQIRNKLRFVKIASRKSWDPSADDCPTQNAVTRTVSELLAVPEHPILDHHRTILRLSRDLDNRILVVTTNFETLLERAVVQVNAKRNTAQYQLRGSGSTCSWQFIIFGYHSYPWQTRGCFTKTRIHPISTDERRLWRRLYALGVGIALSLRSGALQDDRARGLQCERCASSLFPQRA